MGDALAEITPLALVVALTTLPILAVIGVLLRTGRGSRGLWLSLGYAVGLGIVFGLAAFGFAHLELPRLEIGGEVLAGAGVVLLAVAALRYLRRRRHPRPRREPPTRNEPGGGGGPGIVACALLGLQFAVHPENLALTLTAASRAAHLDPLGRGVTLVWFCVVGVSTVLGPSIAFALSGERVRDALARLHDAITRREFLLTELALGAVGAALVVIGVVELVVG